MTIAGCEPLLGQAWVTKVTSASGDSPSIMGGAMTEFEKQIAANLARAEVQRLNKELQRDDAETAAVQNLNNREMRHDKGERQSS